MYHYKINYKTRFGTSKWRYLKNYIDELDYFICWNDQWMQSNDLLSGKKLTQLSISFSVLKINCFSEIVLKYLVYVLFCSTKFLFRDNFVFCSDNFLFYLVSYIRSIGF